MKLSVRPERVREMKRNKWLIGIGLLIAMSVLAGGCGKKISPPPEPQLVKTVTVGGTMDSDTKTTYAGTVRGRYESKLAFQVGGRITARYVQLGSRVQRGQVLMTLNPQDLQSAVQQTQAQVDAATAQVKLAQENYGRFQKLYQEEAVSAVALDQAKTAYRQAAAQYQQALAARQLQRNQLAYTQLTADAPGVISFVNGDPGQVVAPGMPVLTLVHDGDWEVEIHVPENKVADFTVGKTVSVSFWALANAACRGMVREVAPMADPVTKTYTVRVSLWQPPAGMQLGMTAGVVNAAAPKVPQGTYRLPLAAIYQTGHTPHVWVVTKNNRLQLQAVKILAFDDDAVQVGGLSAGAQVVTAGVNLLYEGEQVRTESEET